VSSAAPTTTPTLARAPGALAARLPPEGKRDADGLLDAFLGFVIDRGITLYPAQEEAILELLSGNHVVLSTPTGSGKSLVAVAMLFRTLATRGRAFYTCPIKALVSEKFFELCELFGPEQVGMMTGDASVNRDAPIVCCTAEILSNLALRQGELADLTDVVMDEFHYYADPDRGAAWQVPLLTLPDTQFLLMSATLGDMSAIIESLSDLTDRKVAYVRSTDRPVPLDFVYEELPLTQTVANLVEKGQSPAYVVSFSHREASELAQALTSLPLCSAERRRELTVSFHGFRFDTPFGKDLRRCLSHGIGLHHAGLLPKYRRLVERLAQQGKLSVICGTDTLGVGINVPIRTVVFTKLCKFDGEQTRRLSVREFKQIAGRAGRKGFDDRGRVVCQAPEHVIENKMALGKAGADVKKKRKLVFKKPPDRGYVHWDEAVFHKLAEGEPEALGSRLEVDHGMLLNLLQRPRELRPNGYRAFVRMVQDCHERDVMKRRLRARGKDLFRSLRKAEVVHLVRNERAAGSHVELDPELQREFSLHQALSLYLVEALDVLDSESETYALDVLSFVEAVLENPGVVLDAQASKARDTLFHELKASGVEYDERMAKLDQVTYPKPCAELIYDTFNTYAQHHPWVGTENIRPKSVARDLYERSMSFNDYVKEYGIARAEGVLLRYLSDAYKTLVQSVPERYFDDTLLDATAFLRAALERVDSSLVDEWERMLEGEGAREPQVVQRVHALAADPRVLRSRIRADLHALVRALSRKDWEEALSAVRTSGDEPWTAERIEHAMAPFFARHATLIADHRARQTQWTLVEEQAPQLYRVRQVLLDPEEDNTFYVEGSVDLRDPQAVDGPLVELTHVGE
jgi:superfamily II RNA helicase